MSNFNATNFYKQIKTLDLTESRVLSTKIRNINNHLTGNNIIVLTPNIDNNVISYRFITREEVHNKYHLNVNYSGSNSNIIIWEDLSLKSLSLSMGENGLLYLGQSFIGRHPVNIDLRGINGTVIFGDNCNVGMMHLYAGDEKNIEIIIGDEFMAAVNLDMRPSDGHVIYTLDNPNVAINKPTFGIHISNHVWVGMNVFIGKDVIIPSNCIVGAGALVTRKKFKPNSAICGVPAVTIRENVNWDSRTITRFEKERQKLETDI